MLLECAACRATETRPHGDLPCACGACGGQMRVRFEALALRYHPERICRWCHRVGLFQNHVRTKCPACKGKTVPTASAVGQRLLQAANLEDQCP